MQDSMINSLRWPAVLPDGSRPLLVAGDKYRVTYRTSSQRKDREAVMIFIGLNQSRGKFTSVWSARPLFGTQELPVEQISALELVPYGSQVYVNRVV